MNKLKTLLAELGNLETELTSIEGKEASTTKQLEELAAQAEPDDEKLIEALTALKTRVSLFPNAKRKRLDRIATIQTDLQSEYNLQAKFLTANVIDARKQTIAQIAAGLRPWCASAAEAEGLAAKVSGLKGYDDIITVLSFRHGLGGLSGGTSPADAARGMLATAEQFAKLTGKPVS